MPLKMKVTGCKVASSRDDKATGDSTDWNHPPTPKGRGDKRSKTTDYICRCGGGAVKAEEPIELLIMQDS